MLIVLLLRLYSSTGRELLEGNAIYLFLRLCLLLRQAGEFFYRAQQAATDLSRL